MNVHSRPRILSVLFQSVLSFLFVTGVMNLSAVVAGAQDNPSVIRTKTTITLTTEPSPAQKGTNRVQVKLTDPAGQPISGAEVTVTFSMPAMPSMNMAAMKTVIKGTDIGGGVYEGKGDLGSGGTWQVTVTARQNGQILASKKLTVKATGGM